MDEALDRRSQAGEKIAGQANFQASPIASCVSAGNASQHQTRALIAAL